MPEAHNTIYPFERKGRRVKMIKPLKVRPSDPRDEHFEDMPVSINASREGIYFSTRRKGYYKGMRVFVTFPYSSPHDPMNVEYIAVVVRVDELSNGKFGIALHLQLDVNYSSRGSTGSLTRA